jgi:hypothetical protein
MASPEALSFFLEACGKVVLGARGQHSRRAGGLGHPVSLSPS